MFDSFSPWREVCESALRPGSGEESLLCPNPSRGGRGQRLLLGLGTVGRRSSHEDTVRQEGHVAAAGTLQDWPRNPQARPASSVGS